MHLLASDRDCVMIGSVQCLRFVGLEICSPYFAISKAIHNKRLVRWPHQTRHGALKIQQLNLRTRARTHLPLRRKSLLIHINNYFGKCASLYLIREFKIASKSSIKVDKDVKLRIQLTAISSNGYI